ncbi:hypothetical protein GGX14DRAFT_563512 [Mycena pura]|uniref:Uncharacterized protein n=1 Tax=Mycena pura TaxID=153505 RepID=A0AAD6VIK9_9AGAR|nr:hypothetical protein GGX14DRAFT_563512 [Mycena pura]
MPLDEINLYFDPDELAAMPTNPQFDAKEWRGQGRLYKDLPHYVALELERTRLVPLEILETMLPLDTLSPVGLVHVANSNLPAFSGKHDTAADDKITLTFDESEPNFFPKNAQDLPLPPLKTIQRLDGAYAQAWLDGKNTV